MNGSFFFGDGEEGTRSIDLRILPHGAMEVEETFMVQLSILSGEVDVDPQAGSITLKVFFPMSGRVNIIIAHYLVLNVKEMYTI